MATILTLLLAVVSVVLYYSIKKNLELLQLLDDLNDQVEESLDILDGSYQRISQKASLEVMSDEPVVRELIADMKSAKDALILVANKIVQPLDQTDDLDKEK